MGIAYVKMLVCLCGTAGAPSLPPKGGSSFGLTSVRHLSQGHGNRVTTGSACGLCNHPIRAVCLHSRVHERQTAQPANQPAAILRGVSLRNLPRGFHDGNIGNGLYQPVSNRIKPYQTISTSMYQTERKHFVHKLVYQVRLADRALYH